MGRVIKFRWFHKKSGRMTDWETVLKECDRLSFLFPSDDWVIMQFTGLKDKNDKEIYEGDILSPNKREILWKSNSRLSTVFNCAGWYTRCHKTDFTISGMLGCFTFGITQAEVSEVIGNIYSNPELLQYTPLVR